MGARGYSFSRNRSTMRSSSAAATSAIAAQRAHAMFARSETVKQTTPSNTNASLRLLTGPPEVPRLPLQRPGRR